MPQQYNPTVNENALIGGNINFGSDKFTPEISNLTDDYKLHAVMQRLGRILYIGILIEPDGGDFTLASSVLSPPIKPYLRTVDGAANTTVFKGVIFQDGVAINQEDDGTFELDDAAASTDPVWISGFYWVE